MAGSRAEAQFQVRDPAPGEDFHAELALMWWRPAPTLLVQTDGLAVSGSPEVDFVREFGLEEQRFREFRAVLKPGRSHKVRIDYVPFRYGAETTIARTITFGGRTFTVGLPATADVEWKLWRFGYEYDIVARDRGFLGVIVDAKYNTLAAGVDTPLGSAAADVTAWVPTLGVIARGYLHRSVSVTMEYTGFKTPDFIANRFRDEAEQFDVEFSDFDLYATVSIGRFVGLQGGYRRLTADYLIDRDRGNLRMTGTYVGAMIRF